HRNIGPGPAGAAADLSCVRAGQHRAGRLLPPGRRARSRAAHGHPLSAGPGSPGARRFLPAPGSTRYHLLLGAVALFVLGGRGGIAAAYMTVSLGFSVGAQVLAGILGSVVTYGYGAEGKHGANYIQTMAASVADLAGMCVLIQAMVWLGMPLPAAWKLALY